MLRFILSSLTALSVLLGAIFVAPTAYASADALPSGDLIDGLQIKNLSVVEEFYNTLVSEYDIPGSSFANCGYFAYVTKGVTVQDTMGYKGSRSFSGYCLVCLFCPLNQAAQGRLGVPDGTNYFGINDWESYPWRPNYSGSLRCYFAVGSIVGTGSSQSVESPFVIEKFNFDANGGYPYNSEIKPYLYYNWGSGYNASAVKDYFVDQGEITNFGSVDSISNARLLSGLYDITFTPTVSSPSNFPLIGKSLKVAPVAVRDDTGYNLVSLQVPQLGTYTDVIVFGEYHFVPRKSSSETYFNGLKLSFGSEPLNENDEEYDGTITPSMFSCVVDGQPLKPKVMTVNSFSFFYNTHLHKYSNCEFTIFDYSSTDSHIYPSIRFMGIGSINGMSAGSICYNCDFSGLVSPQTPKQIAKEGEEEISDTVEELGYVPRSVSYPDSSEGFTFDDPNAPDFSALGNIFSFMFNNRIIRAMLEMCLVVGLAGYVMYGKKGD